MGYYTYLQVMRMWELATAKALGIHIPLEPDPEDYPIRQKVRIAECVARDKLGAGYDISWIRSRPKEDQKSGGFKVYVAGYKQMINLRYITPVQPGTAGYKMV